MKSAKVKIPAKINLSLDITGTEGGYHQILSLVASCSLYDAVGVYARKDAIITLREKGIKSGCELSENNAYKAAKLFCETFGTNGADIVIDKSIPVGGGLGGSSADAAAVLLAMGRIYGVNELDGVAAKLGSDVNYMLRGGFALISGRGEKIKPLGRIKPLHLLLITENQAISSRDSYFKFDEMGIDGGNSTQKAAKRLTVGDLQGFAATSHNALYEASLVFCPQMAENITALETAGAIKAQMTGSGSAVYGIFASRKQAVSALKKLRERHTVFYLKTL